MAAAVAVAVLSSAGLGACAAPAAKVGAGASQPAATAPGDFAVRATPPAWAPYHRQIRVFGVPVIATDDVPESKLLHVAVTLAEYLDNDEDGLADEPRVLAALHAHAAYLFMARSWEDVPDPPRALRDGIPQYQGADETFPPGDPPPPELIDIALEEVWHLVSAGWAIAFPEDFGFDPEPGSRLTRAMDRARGGHFLRIPERYPDEAWYHYDDPTCDYSCMAAEYSYWALTSLLGAQAAPARAAAIAREWECPTPAEVRARDLQVTRLLEDSGYALPARLPDGVYRGVTAGSGAPQRTQR